MDRPDALFLGLDIGSTTVKAALVDPVDSTLLYSEYLRHGARQSETAAALCSRIAERFPGKPVHMAVCGSGGKDIADALGVLYVQEVVANSVAVRHRCPQARTAIELGGQDAKIVFFHADPVTGRLYASDMRMNGACAGGTGAFIDEVASLLRVPVEEFNALAMKGTHVFDISGRCGVFAKTDIQPLLNQGVGKEDLALSTFHAIAKQTIGGLAQGLEIRAPVVFVGGPLSYDTELVKVFGERLALSEGDIIVPADSRVMVAFGAALSLMSMQDASALPLDLREVPAVLAALDQRKRASASVAGGAFFADEAERAAFVARHGDAGEVLLRDRPAALPHGPMDLYLGLDGGSTTSKCVALDADDRVVGAWYAHNRGKPIEVMIGLLQQMGEDLAAAGVEARVRSMGTTGYAEALLAKAFKADYHTVETVAHARAALHFVPGASFILDIGGQDMKAIFTDNEIVTGIVLNEACSAGCGSFLENFASSLEIPVEEIAASAFVSHSPSNLGSRCTVFMNSSIITEQKNGKGPDDIMAGLCRSIVENVFSKVVRVSNLDMLGKKIVVQGGTFRNDAVLRAVEQYTAREVVRAPYAGEMGAIGIALLARHHRESVGQTGPSAFIGFDALRDFTYTLKTQMLCPFCTNNCSRTVVEFSDGGSYVTGNRCERGEAVSSAAPTDAVTRAAAKTEKVPDLVREREELLFADWPVRQVSPAKDMRIGLPRVLEFWNSLPFWKGFFTALGFEVVVSDRSTQKLFQSGLHNVPSDTVCFPAKLAHGHLKDLTAKGVDRIFMPMQNRMPPENPSTTGNHVCAVVKGYPLVLHYSDEPERRSGVVFDHPMFHWFDDVSRRRQVADWVLSTFGLPEQMTNLAIDEGDSAQNGFREELVRRGSALLARLEDEERAGRPGFAVVMAGRPYHGDFLVNHDLDRLFTRQGIPVLPVDALPGLDEVDLSATRVETTTPFHTRMYGAAIITARDPHLEMVQMVSFGCGHDAVISDEVGSIMHSIAGKTPLILKLDESDVKGPLAIRVRSFVETVRARRAKQEYRLSPLPDPFDVKFTAKEKATKTILIPNLTEAFSKVLQSAMTSEGYRVEVLPMADRAAIALGKQYVHNDMCYPAQVNVGEMLGALRSGLYDPDKVVCGLAKAECDCRLAHYAALARKALDEAGYPQVPIITTDRDNKGMHPAFALGLRFQLRTIWGLNMVDILEHVRRRLRPYELVEGQADEVFEESVERIAAALRRSIRGALREFDAAIDKFAAMPADLRTRRPRVFVIGEFLLNFHAGSNNNIERYLEANGLEVVLPDTFTPMHRDVLKKDSESRLFFVKYPFLDMFANSLTLKTVDRVKREVNRRASRLPFFDAPASLRELAKLSDPVVHHTFTAGEGWLIAAEILHHADLGVKSFVILQPFGCLPNHVVGRGLTKEIKERRPGIQILALDFDPDTSSANIENRLQMLIINAREAAQSGSAAALVMP
jgi:predicted CoA-substrate-specific enzyme activase